MGKTVRQLFRRKSEHLYRFQRHKKLKCLLYHHLAKHIHNLKNVTVQTLEVIKNNLDNHINNSRTSRKISKLDWIKNANNLWVLMLILFAKVTYLEHHLLTSGHCRQEKT